MSDSCMEETIDINAKRAVALQQPATSTKTIVACSLGNALEWFDFVAYAMFATVIAKSFFPAENELTSLLSTFGTFAVGFLMRPIGAIVLGGYADRAGRKAGLTATILLMAVGTAIIAFTPTYAAIGPAASVLMVFARMIQGFSAGGEIGGAISFLVEHAPREKRALFSGWLQASVGGFYILAGAVGFLITQTLTPEQIEHWGWRLPFLFGLCIVPVGFYIRSQLAETPLFLEKGADHKGVPILALFRGHLSRLAIGVGIVTVWTACSQMINYMPTYTLHELGMENSAAFLGFFILGFISMLAPLVGAWSDRIGRRPIMIAAAIGILIFSYPAFNTLVSHKSLQLFIAVQVMMAVLLTLYSGPASATLAELFTTDVRSTGIAIAYNTSVTLFGGAAPALSMIIISYTGDKAGLAYYLMAAALISFIALLFVRDRTGESLH